MWVAELLEKVSAHINGSKSVALACREKYNQEYLKSFPQWELITVKTTEPHHNAEDIRYRYFTYDTSYARFVHDNVAKFMKTFADSPEFLSLKSDFDYVRKYKASWDGAPFKPIFVTVDSVIVRSGHILLVKRKGNPGKGQMALPGGFLDQQELIEDAALREVKEETAIKMSKDELRACIKYYDVFDAPKRSLRGRTITHAYLIDLGTGPLPKVKGSDDAEKAFWLPLNEVKDREDEFFEDHFHIISSLTHKL
jgi:bifunctional NMN adenylyltransferase/nudix hydrolase